MDDIAVGGGAFGDPNNGGLGGDAGAVEDFSSLSTQQKLLHSNWKARKEGLEDVAGSAASGKDAFFGALAKLLKESNPSCLEAFFDAVIAIFGVVSDAEVTSVENDVLKLVVEKGITGRPKAVSSCEKILKGLVAMPSATHAQAVQTRLSAAIGHRTPKNRQAVATAFAAIVETFGPSKLGLKQLMKEILPLFSDQNAAVRKETQNFAVQVYRHIGPGINPFLSELRDVQTAELQKLFEAAQPIAPSGGANGAGGGAGDGDDDNANTGGSGSGPSSSAAGPYSHILPPPPTDGNFYANSPDTVLKMNKEWLNMALDKGTKWQDRNKAAQDLFKPLQTAFRLRGDVDYTDLVKLMRDLLNDPQVPLNTTSFKAIQDLAKTVRDNLSPYVRHIIPAVFDKFKDKKTPVIEHVYTTLGMLLSYKCCTFEQLQEEIDSAMASKIPHHRVAIITWLNLIVPMLPPATVKARLARAQHFPKLLTDEKTDVKDGTLLLLGKIIGACGEGAVNSQMMNNLDAKQMAKVRQGMEGGGGGAGGGAAAESPQKSVARRPTGVSSSEASSAAAHHHQTAPMSTVKSPRGMGPSSFPTGGGGAAAATSSNAAPPSRGIPRRGTAVSSGAGSGFDYGDPGSFEGQMPSKMDAFSTLSTFLAEESEVMGNLSNKEWSKRQAAVSVIENFARERWGPSECAKVVDALIIQFQNDPGFKESIFQVNIVMISTILYAVRTAAVVTNKAAFVLIQHLGNKLSDAKCKASYKELLTALAESVGPRFVIKYLTSLMMTLNQPKLTAEGLDWILRALFEFNRSPIDARVIIKYVKAHCFDTQAPNVKAAGVQLLVALRQRVGPEIDSQLADVNPHLRTTIGNEIAKGVNPPADVVARVVKPSANEEALPEGAGGMIYMGGALGLGVAGGSGGGSVLSPSSQLSLGGASPFISVTSPVPNAMSTASLSSAAGAGGGGPTSSPARSRSAMNLKAGASATSTTNAASGGGMSPQQQSAGSRRPTLNGPSGAGGQQQQQLSAPGMLMAGGNVSARGSASSVGTSNTDLASGGGDAIGPDGDCSHLMGPLIKEIVNATDWRLRLTAVKKVESLLRPEGRTVNSHAAAELLKALKTRFDEVNKNLIVDVLRVMNVVVDAAGSGNGCRAGMKAVLPAVLNFLGDQKQQLRDEATYFCQVAFQTLGAEHVLPYAAKPLTNEAQFARLSIVSLLENVFEQYVQAQEQSATPPPVLGPRHVQHLIPPLLKLLMDRLGDVRLGAEHVLIYVIHIAGIDIVQKAVLDLRQADRQQVKIIVERCVQQVALSAPHEDDEDMDGMMDGGCEDDDNVHDYAEEEADFRPVEQQSPSSSLYGNPMQQYQQQTPSAHPYNQNQQHHYQQIARQQHHDDDNYLPAAAGTISGSAPISRQHMATGGFSTAAASSPIPQQQQQISFVQSPHQQQMNHATSQSMGGGMRGVGGGPNGVVVPPLSMVRSPMPTQQQHHVAQQQQQPAPAPMATAHFGGAVSPPPQQYALASSAVASHVEEDSFLNALVNGSNEAATTACAEFIPRLKADGGACANGFVITALCNRLRATIGARSSDDLNVYLQQGMETPPPPRTQPVDIPLAAGLTECLTAIFASPDAMATLEVLTLTVVFNVIIDSIMSDPPDQLVRSLNNFALGVVMKSPADCAYRAMILCLADYTLPYLNISNQTNHKYMTLILKCLMRLDVTRLSPSVLISASHDYLEIHPPSQFRAKDDLAIRTIKTKIQTMCGLHGQSLLQLAEEEGGSTSIVVHLVRAALDASRNGGGGGGGGGTSPNNSSSAALPPPHQQISTISAAAAAHQPPQQQQRSVVPAAQQQYHQDPMASSMGRGVGAPAAPSLARGGMGPRMSVSSAPAGAGIVPSSIMQQQQHATSSGASTTRPQQVSPSRQGVLARAGVSPSAVRTGSPQSQQGFARPVSPHHRNGVAGTTSATRTGGATGASAVGTRRSISPYSSASGSTAAAAGGRGPGTVSPSSQGFRQSAISPSRLGGAASAAPQQQQPSLARGASFSHHGGAPSASPAAASTSLYTPAERQAMVGQLGEIFSMARKPDETAMGLQRMYAFIKSGAVEDTAIRTRFEKHFAECSEPFRNYLGKRLNTARTNDGPQGAAVKMPTIINETLIAQGLIK